MRIWWLAFLLGVVACSNTKTADGGGESTADVTDGADAQVADSGATDASAGDTADAAGTDALADALVDVADAGADVQPADASDAQSDDATLPDSAAPDASDTGPDVAVDTASDAVDAGYNQNPCGVLGGICASYASDCTGGGGTLLPAGDGGCIFDDGPGVCCKPPAMKDSSTSCADFGGICASISGCNFVGGSFAAFSGCKGIPMVCCVPHSVCGEEDQSCCNDMTTFRTACDHGKWVCTIDGTVMKPTDQCPK